VAGDGGGATGATGATGHPMSEPRDPFECWYSLADAAARLGVTTRMPEFNPAQKAAFSAAARPGPLPHPGDGSVGSELSMSGAAVLYSPLAHAGPANALAGTTRRAGVSAPAGPVGTHQFSVSHVVGSLHAAQPAECIRPAALL
jgi:hypothetical protein